MRYGIGWGGQIGEGHLFLAPRPRARSSAFRDTAIEGRRNGREEQYPSRSRKPPMKGLADGKNSENLANKGRRFEVPY